MSVCQLCNGTLALLGQLGNLKHYRCINCGMMFSRAGRRRKAKGTK